MLEIVLHEIMIYELLDLRGQVVAGVLLVEEREPGVWMVRTATVIPDNERWIHEAQAAADLRKTLDWASKTPASDAGAQAILDRLSDGQV